jgi:predicted esterase
VQLLIKRYSVLCNKKGEIMKRFAVLILFLCGCTTQPSQSEIGYGSSENYISTTFTSYTLGQEEDASRIWIFTPDVLKHETTAPAVILLHGYLSADPIIYQGLINHILKQGVIVLFPQYQKSGLSPVISDLDLSVQLQRAIDAVAFALDDISELVESDNIILFGHSTGALFGLCWMASNGPVVQQMIIAHPCLDFTTWLPASITNRMTFPDHATMAPVTTVPIIQLWGDQDNFFATWPEQVETYSLLTNVESKALYVAQSDTHGSPSLVADHIATVSFFDDDISNDSLDYRYYFAVIDAALDSQVKIEFDMGKWSDSVSIKPILDCTPPESCPQFF